MPPYTRRDFFSQRLCRCCSGNIFNEFTRYGVDTGTPVTTLLTSAFTTLHEPKPLPFSPAKLDGLSEKLISSHWGNNYTGSVKALNTVKQTDCHRLE